MLVVRGLGDPVEASIRVDPYVLLDVCFGARPGRERLYWRCGPPPASLVEVGVWPDGVLASATVSTLAPGRIVEGDLPGASPIEPGAPIVDTAPWPGPFSGWANRFVDSGDHASLVVGPSGVALWLSEPRSVGRWIGDARLAFGVGRDDALLAIRLDRLPAADVRRLLG